LFVVVVVEVAVAASTSTFITVVARARLPVRGPPRLLALLALLVLVLVNTAAKKETKRGFFLLKASTRTDVRPSPLSMAVVPTTFVDWLCTLYSWIATSSV
jgi:hypothetical protein